MLSGWKGVRIFFFLIKKLNFFILGVETRAFKRATSTPPTLKNVILFSLVFILR